MNYLGSREPSSRGPLAQMRTHRADLSHRPSSTRDCPRNGVSGSIARQGRRSHDDRDNNQQQLVGDGVGQTGGCDPNTTVPAG